MSTETFAKTFLRRSLLKKIRCKNSCSVHLDQIWRCCWLSWSRGKTSMKFVHPLISAKLIKLVPKYMFSVLLSVCLWTFVFLNLFLTFHIFYIFWVREAAKKSSFLSGRVAKRGGGLNGCATKEKITFLM